MKQGTLITKIIMFILFIGVVIYMAIYAVQSLADPFTTAIAYQDTLDDSVKITGMVVRGEQALSDGATIIDVLPDEGERVAAGETVAILYQNNNALDHQKQLQALEQERDQLQYALNSGNSLSDAAKLEQQIISSILDLRANTSSGDLSTVESNALSLRTLVLQREFAYSASGDSAAALRESIAELDEQIASLETQVSDVTTSIYAPCSGLFSRVSDGLEAILTPDSLETMTTDDFKSISSQADSSSSTNVGKLITGNTWYFVAVVDASTAARLRVGSTITVSFSHDYTGEMPMQVERIGDQEADGCILVLSYDRNLKDVTLLRTQTVDLIFNRYTGVRVPKQALRMETVTVTDSETETERQSQVLGVYTVAGAQAEFIPVDIIREGRDYYLVSSAKESDYFLTISATEARKRILRAGDEIIVTASDLYDGKVVLE